MLKVEIKRSVLKRRLGRLYTGFFPYVEMTFKKFADVAYREVRDLTMDTAPGRTDLKNTWKIKHQYLKTKQKYKIYSDYRNWKVMWWREVGTKRHDIIGHPYLHFYWAKKGRWVKIHKVNHPGTRAYLMLRIAKLHFEDNIDDYIGGIEKTIRRMMNYGIR